MASTDCKNARLARNVPASRDDIPKSAWFEFQLTPVFPRLPLFKFQSLVSNLLRAAGILTL